MADAIRGGNSPDRTARFLERLGGKSRVRSAADPVVVDEETEVAQPDQATPRYIPTSEDLGKLTERRLREIAEKDLGVEVPDELVLKSEIVDFVLKELNR